MLGGGLMSEIIQKSPALTPAEADELAGHEAVIESGLQTFMDVGNRLAMVRDKRLYRADYATFEDYCTRRWHFSGRRARQLIDAASVVYALPAGTIVPLTESQARQLGGLSPNDAAEVMRLAHYETGGGVTAKAITAARERVHERCYPYREHELIALFPWDQWVVDGIAEGLDRDRDPGRPDQLTPGSASAVLAEVCPIVLSADGTTIIDGRLRYAAYRKAGIRPRFTRWPHATSIWTAPDDDMQTIWDFIAGMHLLRTHLTEGQRAFVAVELAQRSGERA